MIKIGDGYVHLSDYMEELREAINLDTVIEKTWHIREDWISIRYPKGIHGMVSYSDGHIKLLIWWNTASEPKPVDEQRFDMPAEDNIDHVALTLLAFIRDYAHALAVAKEKLN